VVRCSFTHQIRRAKNGRVEWLLRRFFSGDRALSVTDRERISSHAPIRVCVTCQTRLHREGLAHILNESAAVTVSALAASGPETMAHVSGMQIDIVLLDMALPNPLDIIRSLSSEFPATKVVAVGVPEEDRDLIDCAEAGVSGYLTRDYPLADVVAAIEAVASNEMRCSPRVAAALLRRVKRLSAAVAQASDPPARLTARELEILELIDEGLPNKTIARRLCIELPTVKNHVHNILEKLEVNGRAEAAARLRSYKLAQV